MPGNGYFSPAHSRVSIEPPGSERYAGDDKQDGDNRHRDDMPGHGGEVFLGQMGDDSKPCTHGEAERQGQQRQFQQDRVGEGIGKVQPLADIRQHSIGQKQARYHLDDQCRHADLFVNRLKLQQPGG